MAKVSTLKNNEEDLLTRKLELLNFSFHEISHPKKRGTTVVWAVPDYFPTCILPRQGYKIHISAHVQNYDAIFDIVYPYLQAANIPFKVIGSFSLLRKFNSDEFGYSQSGKYITIYTKSATQCKEIADHLSEKLSNFRSHAIPFDLQYKNDSVVFIRYGSFKASPSGRTYLIKPDGTKQIDNRYGSAIPNWLEDNPFHALQTVKTQNSSLLFDRFILIKTIQQRSKGMVSLALDLQHHTKTPKLIILKEARRLGEIDEKGVDAVNRLRWQEQVTNMFSEYNICPKIEVPYIKTSSGAILGFEYIPSRNLAQRIVGKQTFKLSEAFTLILNIARKIEIMHQHQMYFFDLAPPNILITSKSDFLIDFEYSYSQDAPSFPGWTMGTRGFAPLINVIDRKEFSLTKKLILRDIFALSGILLGLICKEWYKNLIKGIYHFDENFGVTPFINTLEKEIGNVIIKGRLLEKENEHYNNLNEFINDIENFKNAHNHC